MRGMLLGFVLSAGLLPAAVTVHIVDNVPVAPAVTVRATHEASRILAGVGVTVEWKTGAPRHDIREEAQCPSQGGRVIVLTIAGNTFRNVPAVARANANLRTNSITVFWGRMYDISENWPSFLPTFLAHVMVHEITHVLEGVDRHADSGVMKARWDFEDFHEMEERTLSFTPLDVQLIRNGMAARPRLAGPCGLRNAEGDAVGVRLRVAEQGDADAEVTGVAGRAETALDREVQTVGIGFDGESAAELQGLGGIASDGARRLAGDRAGEAHRSGGR